MRFAYFLRKGGLFVSDYTKVSVVLPSLDPDDKLLTVIDGLLEYGFTDIILINDGSKPENMHYFETAAQHPQVQLLHHEVNRGKGAALKTAFTWFLENRPEGAGVVTVDGDNQHHPEDTKACAAHMLESSKIVLGVRDFSLPQVPARSRTGNRITSMVFKIFVGMKISDTQTGLRAFPRSVLERLLTVSGDRFEYETNMLLFMKQKELDFEEVKIRTVYIEENKSSHFHAVRDSWRIYKLILAHFFKYTASSLVSSVVDWGVFVLMTAWLKTSLTGIALTAIPLIVARTTSSWVNFVINQKLVFHSECSTCKALFKYYVTAVPLAVAQMLLTHAINSAFSIDEHAVLLRSLIYAVVMTVLFFVNFFIQQKWVFTTKRGK